jgi:hypothetical protein
MESSDIKRYNSRELFFDTDTYHYWRYHGEIRKYGSPVRD